MAGFNYMTKGGYDKMVKELDELKSTGRKEAAQAIAEAREKGDISENAEYDAAKDAQAMLEMKISEMEQILANSRVIDESKLDTSRVVILSKVTIKNVKNGMEMSYKLVSESEANLKEKKVSIGSPLGQGLLGKEVGDIAQINTPTGLIDFEIVDISF
ncbi:MAG TPA: transcription elongation factor GreA [Saprospiraceae bacterium]|nr:transcription elongation factor GreA [Saprospirales bacterium]HRQ31383.1 transcription elongation factor GreA [Saprospiraceae bacterium]